MSPRRAMISTRSKEPVSLCSKRKATSISADPITVTTRNRVAARRRPAGSCSSPQSAITNHIGISTTSKNTKNTIRSRDTKVPIDPASISRTSASSARSAPTFGARRNIAITQHQVSTAVSTTSGALNASTPSRQPMPSGSIQVSSVSSSNPPSAITTYPDTDRHQEGDSRRGKRNQGRLMARQRKDRNHQRSKGRHRNQEVENTHDCTSPTMTATATAPTTIAVT